MLRPLLISLLLCLSNTLSAANIKAGEEIAATVCSQCHGIKTPALETLNPVLAGRDARQLRIILQEYRNKTRISPVMNNLAGSLSDKDIANISEYYSGL